MYLLRFCPDELDEWGTRSGMTSDLTRPKRSGDKGNRVTDVPLSYLLFYNKNESISPERPVFGLKSLRMLRSGLWW